MMINLVRSLFNNRIICSVYLWTVAVACTFSREEQAGYPKVHDQNLRLELIASDPDIVTPIGIAIDEKDRLYILESHTHSPPRDYQGPEYDRIKKGIDENRDGTPERWVIFADSIQNGANLAIDSSGKVYVAAMKSICSYEDINDDGISDHRKILLSMPEPEYVYDHAGFLGVALGPDDWVYVSRGNVSGKAWRIEGADGKVLEGYGEGGIVVRCKTDGSHLEKIATGFWNPFDLRFTRDGRLLLTDNDPDSRGPNRLIEIVPGGDYGFKDLYGGSGLHPYVSWNGELPGTLPVIAPLGEAPCGLWDAGETNFGPGYARTILVNVWEENSIVQIPLELSGSTVKGQGKVLVQGDSSFHPVSMASDSRGNLYITDWVVRQYPNHGKGKIWRLSNQKQSELVKTPPAEYVNRFTPYESSTNKLLPLLRSGDEFQKASARYNLRHENYREEIEDLFKKDDATLRLQALITFLKMDYQVPKKNLEALILDSDLQVRRMAMIYTGTRMRTELAPALEQALAKGLIGPELFETYLATLQHLQPEFIANYNSRSGVTADKQKQKLPHRYIENLVTNGKVPEDVRALALPYLENPKENQQLLLDLLRKAEQEDFRLALMKSLKQVIDQEVAKEFVSIATNNKNTNTLRAQAVLLLTFQTGSYCDEVSPLLMESDEVLKHTTLKYLCRCSKDGELKAKVEQVLASSSERYRSVWNLCAMNDGKESSRVETFKAAVKADGDILNGRLVFESASAMCQSCHKIDGWGGNFGPDLSAVGSSKSREQLVKAVLEPSAEISPEWQGWYVVDSTGVKHTGRQIDVNKTFTELLNMAGSFDRFEQPRSFGVLDASLMPENLHQSMTPEEFNDLIAYLESLK